jgi:hypothetical protein
MENKVCTKCCEEKLLCEFNIFYNTKKHRSYCKECQKKERKKNDINYRNNNKDSVKQSQIKYKQNNSDKIKIFDKQYREKNKEKIKLKNRDWRNKVSNNPYYKLKNNVSKSISKIIKRNGYTKNSRTHEILGCSYDEFKTHIESLWEPWMNWDNYGNPKDGVYEPNKTWDIDHILPTSSAITEEELLELNHYSNLQPLCSYYNRFIKRDN